jgi:hypothetical protein
MTFRMDMSTSERTDADLYYQTYTGYPDGKRKRKEEIEEAEVSGGSSASGHHTHHAHVNSY